jgi:hypothetical protein
MVSFVWFEQIDPSMRLASFPTHTIDGGVKRGAVLMVAGSTKMDSEER